MGGGGGPRRGPRPPGSTNFSASSSSILLLFFSLKERENKRRVSITLHTGRREGMGGEGTGRGVGGPRVAAATAHRRALTTQPGPARLQSLSTYGSSPSAILFSASSQVPPRRAGRRGRKEAKGRGQQGELERGGEERIGAKGRGQRKGWS